MFTPHNVGSGWPITPKSGVQKGGADAASNPGSCRSYGTDGKAANPLSAALDQEGMAEMISRLEYEVFEYQYNMGLLLIEKKDWTLKYEELKQALAEAKDTFKRERMAHMIAISDAEKQEENLKKALGFEKKCTLDLEKALREMRAENAEIKFTSDSKLAEANALVASIEEKSLEVEKKLRAADAKLAEVSRKNSEVERKLQDLEAREGALRKDCRSFVAEWEAHDTTLSKQRDDLREWERKLQDAEERFDKGQTILNQREERANENDRMVKQKEKDLEDFQKKINSANLALERKEKDISSRLANIALKEQESDALKVTLDIKEKELLALEEKLSAHERVEIQKLLDEHNVILDAKKVEFDLEIDQKRKSLDEELKNKVSEVEKKEAEIKHKEEKLDKGEQALEKRTEKFKEKEAEYDEKFKALKQREKCMKSEEANLEMEKKQLLVDTVDLSSLKAEVEKIRAENEAQLLKLHEERESVQVSETERSDFLCMQSELKQEVEKYRQQKELLLNEAKDLKQQKETFEREWEELDEKRAQVEKEQKTLLLQKEEFEKRIFSEEERLKNERSETEAYINREQENLKLAQESFAASMEHEKSTVAEKAQSEKSQMLHDFELQKRELESAVQNQVEEKDIEFREKERLFKDEKERELENINVLRDTARRKTDELKLERLKTEKEKQEAKANRDYLEKQRIEIRKDIEELLELSNKLKDQRERLVAERDRFISFVGKHTTCKNCGETASEFELTDLQPLYGTENADILNLPGLPDRYMETQRLEMSPGGNLTASDVRNGERTPGIPGRKSLKLGGTVSWLRKCTSKIMKFPPGKKIASPAFEKQDAEEPILEDEQCHLMPACEDEAEISLATASDFLDDRRIQSDVSGREVEEPSQNLSTDQSNINSKAPEVAVDSQPYDVKGIEPKLRPKRGRPKISRTQSVKEVVEDAKAMIGDRNENAEVSNQLNETRDKSVLADGSTNLRKRMRANSSQIAGENDSEKEVSLATASDFLDDKRIQSDVSGREVEEQSQNLSTDQSNINSKAPEVAVDSQPSDVNGNEPKPRAKRGRPKISRTQSIKAVVEDVKAIIGEPNENAEDSNQLNEARDKSGLADGSTSLRKRMRANSSQIVGENDSETEVSLATASDFLDDKRIQSDVSGKEVEEQSQNLSTDQSNINSKAPEVAVDSQPSGVNGNEPKPRAKRGRPKISRTQSVKAVVEDAKAIIGDPNENSEDSNQLNETRDKSGLADGSTQRNLLKRTRANSSQIAGENDRDDNEVCSGSVVVQPWKRQQTAAETPEKRYNLRRNKA